MGVNLQEMMQEKQSARQDFSMTKPISNNEKQFTRYYASLQNDCVDYQFYVGDDIQSIQGSHHTKGSTIQQ